MSYGYRDKFATTENTTPAATPEPEQQPAGDEQPVDLVEDDDTDD